MPRRILDLLLSSAGAVLTIALLVAGALMMWGYSFANGNVRDQLAAQEIFFPPEDSPALDDPRIGPHLRPYAGEQLLTGQQAKAYADHFIGVHLEDVAGGRTYAQVSGEAQLRPEDPELAAQAQTLFRGETLRGLLLSAYAFWKVGQLALIGSIVSFALGGVMLVLTLLGFWHARRVARTEETTAAPGEAHRQRSA